MADGAGLDIGWKVGPKRTSITIKDGKGTKITLAHESTSAGRGDLVFLVNLLPAAMAQISVLMEKENTADVIEK